MNRTRPIRAARDAAPTTLRCAACGATETRVAARLGRCPSCLAFGTMAAHDGLAVRETSSRTAARSLASIALDALPRRSTGLAELDRVLGQGPQGHGVVAGQAVLLSGEPGIGKSTILLQALAGLCSDGGRALYGSGEESAEQIRGRAGRLDLGETLERIDVVEAHELAALEEAITSGRYVAAVVDSVQMVRVAEREAEAGSIRAVKLAAERLSAAAKAHDVVLWLVAQATKDGRIAGPLAAEHAVDTVLWVEADTSGGYRLARSIKNRFGPSGELAMFEMAPNGLREVADPSALFVGARLARPRPPGAAWALVAHSDRALAIEVQALVTDASGAAARRIASGVDAGRLALLLAVLERRASIEIGAGRDVFVDVDAGMRIAERAIDLPLALALASAALDRELPAGVIACGEIALSGELRPVPRLAARLGEAVRLGFTVAVVPAESAALARDLAPGLRLEPVSTVAEAIERVVAR